MCQPKECMLNRVLNSCSPSSARYLWGFCVYVCQQIECMLSQHCKTCTEDLGISITGGIQRARVCGGKGALLRRKSPSFMPVEHVVLVSTEGVRIGRCAAAGHVRGTWTSTCTVEAVLKHDASPWHKKRTHIATGGCCPACNRTPGAAFPLRMHLGPSWAVLLVLVTTMLNMP